MCNIYVRLSSPDPADATSQTHLVIQLLVQVCDEGLILSLLLFRQRDSGWVQAVNHFWCLSVALHGSATQLLLYRYRLTYTSSDETRDNQWFFLIPYHR